MADFLNPQFLKKKICGWLEAIRNCFVMSPDFTHSLLSFSMEDAKKEILPHEQFYRRIPDSAAYLKTNEAGRILLDESGKPKLSSQAFGDKSKRISVDRAKFFDNIPQRARERQTDYVVSLQIEAIKAIRTVPAHDKSSSRVIDVHPDPLGEHCIVKTQQQKPQNPAHCFVRADPMFDKKDNNHFKKLKEALVRIYRWEIEPASDHQPPQSS